MRLYGGEDVFDEPQAPFQFRGQIGELLDQIEDIRSVLAPLQPPEEFIRDLLDPTFTISHCLVSNSACTESQHYPRREANAVPLFLLRSNSHMVVNHAEALRMAMKSPRV